MPSSHLILCHPLLLLPPIPPSIRVFSNESTLRMKWPKYWSFSFSIIPYKEIPGLISFRMDWLDLQWLRLCLSAQGSLIPGWGAKIPRARWPKKNKTKQKQKQYCNKLSKDCKNDPHWKKTFKAQRNWHLDQDSKEVRELGLWILQRKMLKILKEFRNFLKESSFYF